MKKIIHILLSLLMIFSMFSVNVVAETGFYVVEENGKSIQYDSEHGVINAVKGTTAKLSFYYNGTKLDYEEIEYEEYDRDEDGEIISQTFEYDEINGTITFINEGGGAFAYRPSKDEVEIIGVYCYVPEDGIYVSNDFGTYEDESERRKYKLTELSIDVFGDNTLYFYYCDENGVFTQLYLEDLTCKNENLLSIGEVNKKILLTPRGVLGESELVYSKKGNTVATLPVRITMPWFYAVLGETLATDYSNLYLPGNVVNGNVGDSTAFSVYCNDEQLTADQLTISDPKVVTYKNGKLEFLSVGNTSISYQFDENPNAVVLINVQVFASDDSYEEGLYTTNDMMSYFSGEQYAKYEFKSQNCDYLNGLSLVFLYCDGNGNFTKLDADEFTLSRSDVVELKNSMMNFGNVKGDGIRVIPQQGSVGSTVELTYKAENGKSFKSNITVTAPNFFLVEGTTVNADYSNAKTYLEGQVGESKTITVFENGVAVPSSKLSIADSNIATYSNGTVTFVNNGQTMLKYQFDDNDPNMYMALMIMVGNGGGNQIPRSCRFEHNGKKYEIGLGHATVSESGTQVLHIDGANLADVSASKFNMSLVLGIGVIDQEGKMIGVADQKFYDGVSNVIVTTNPSDIISATVTDKKDTGLGVQSNFVDIEVPANTLVDGWINVELDLTVDGETRHFSFRNQLVIHEKTEASGELDSGDNLFDILSSRENFVKYCEKIGIPESTLNENTHIEINLGNNKTYHGVLTINISEKPDDIGSVVLKGNGTTTFKGCVNVLSGTPEFNGINFIADDDCKISSTKGDFAVGIYARDDNNSHPYSFADVWNVHNCTFTGYDYGVWGEKYALVSGIKDSMFVDCGVGICIDARAQRWYSDYERDKFINCDKAVAILEYCLSNYQLVMSDMEFYNNKTDGIDFYVEHPGNYYFTGNYYATEYTGTSADKQNDNVRSAKVVYKSGITSELATNPCVRYPESTSEKYGLDPLPGLYSKIPVGVTMKINAQDLLNLGSTNSVNLTLFDPNNDYKPSGALQFGGKN